MTMSEKAVIDRITEGLGILLVGEAEREIRVPMAQLPSGAEAGTWLRVRLDGNRLIEAEIDEVETTDARNRIQGKLNRLRHRGRKGPNQD
jgi:prophage tail gpP-like protein